MSYGLPQEKPRARKKGGGLFFLIILAVGAFLLFSRSAPQPPANNPIEPASGHVGLEDEADKEYQQQRDEILGSNEKQMPTTGKTGAAQGWKMEDVSTQKDPQAQTSNSKTEKGDWAIEEVDPKKKDDNQFQFSNPGNAKPAETDSGGDWQIEDVKKNKKTESGDWAIEETNATENDK